MKLLRHITLSICLILVNNAIFAFDHNSSITIGGDSLRPHLKNLEQKDTIRHSELPDEYKAFKRATSQFKWMQKAFDIIIREPNPPKDSKHSITEDFVDYEGKVIRKILVTTLQPFGTNVFEPDSVNKKYKKINDFHMSTKPSVVRRLLQFKRGQRLKPIMLSESETILRDAEYISDARISVIPLEHTTDSVDVAIIVRDKWTIGVDIHRITSKRTDIEFFDKNLFGHGNRGSISMIYSQKHSNKFGYGAEYKLRNLGGTSIDIGAMYLDNVEIRQIGLLAERQLQPKVNYFGKISYDQTNIRTYYQKWDSISPDYLQSFNIAFGRAFTLPSDNTIKRLVISGKFEQKMPEYRDPYHIQHLKGKLLPYGSIQNKMWLGQITLYENSYMRDYLVHNFGVTEDIAQGYNISLQGGYSKFMTPGIPDATYASMKLSYGTHRLIEGYMFSELSLSSFFSKNKAYESFLSYNLKYYSRLKKLSFGRFRQFFTFRYAKLLSPDRYFDNRIHLGDYVYCRTRDYDRTRGGKEQIHLRSESNLFTNYSVAGFRFMFYNFIDFGYQTPTNDLFNSRNMFLGAGLGIRIRNDLLVFRNIDIKFGYYPKAARYEQNKAFDISTSTPRVSPRFTPEYPEVIIVK